MNSGLFVPGVVQPAHLVQFGHSCLGVSPCFCDAIPLKFITPACQSSSCPIVRAIPTAFGIPKSIVCFQILGILRLVGRVPSHDWRLAIQQNDIYTPGS